MIILDILLKVFITVTIAVVIATSVVVLKAIIHLAIINTHKDQQNKHSFKKNKKK